VIVGSGDDGFLAWSYADGQVQRLDVPDVEVGDAGIPAPVVWNNRTAIVAPDGDHTVIAVDDADGEGWGLWAGPTGIPIAAAAWGANLYVLTTEGGSVRLWMTTTAP
jgi:hypothetical protein